jgi:hypothetical protein
MAEYLLFSFIDDSVYGFGNSDLKKAKCTVSLGVWVV